MRTQTRRSTVGRLVVFALAGLMDVGLAGEEPQDSSGPLDGSWEDAAFEWQISELIRLQEAIQIVKEDTEVITCELRERKIVKMEVLEVTKKAGQSSWTEKWTADRCGQPIHYTVQVTRTLEEGQPHFKFSFVDDK